MSKILQEGPRKNRTRKTEPLNAFVLKEIDTSVLVTADENLELIGNSRTKQTVAKPATNLSMQPLFAVLWSESQIEHYAWKEHKAQQPIAFKDKQDFIDDLFLRKMKIISTQSVATKYGFDKTIYNRKTKKPKLDPGKSRLNTVIKNYFFGSGGRIDYRTPRIYSKGVKHLNKNNVWINESVEILEQFELVRNLKANDNQRKLYKYSEWLDDLLIDVQALKSKNTIIKNGKKYIDLDKVKQDMNILLTYPKYTSYKLKLHEIITNFKLDNK